MHIDRVIVDDRDLARRLWVRVQEFIPGMRAGRQVEGAQRAIPLASDVVESWYRQDTVLHGQKEFFVADPDGYLYRFYEYIGERRA